MPSSRFSIATLLLVALACSDARAQRVIEFGQQPKKPVTLEDVRAQIKAMAPSIKRLERPLSDYEAICRSGDLRGCALVGVYRQQHGDLVEAARMYKQTCLQSDILSCLSLGLLEFEAGHYESSIMAFHGACKAGMAESCIVRDQINDRMPASR